MGTALLKIKVMPKDPGIDLEQLKQKIKEKVDSAGGTLDLESVQEQPVAFGLKALILIIVWPEEKETSLVEDAVSSLEEVSSFDVIDFRRAFG